MTTVTPISVSSSATSTQLVAADGNRLSLVIENTDASRAYIRVGTQDATTAVGGFTFSLVQGASANIDAPHAYEAMQVIWAGSGSGGITGTAISSDSGYGAADDTFGDMKARIASDLERALTDVTFDARTWDTEFGAAIMDAIRLYQSKHWWFLQEPVSTDRTVTTVASDSYAAEPDGLVQVNTMKITASGQKLDMREIGHQQMEEWHEGSVSAGEPYAYTRWGGRFRLYPTPNDAYTLTVTGLFEQAALTGDDVANAWMNEGELVIRSMAKLILLRDYIRSYEDVPAAEQAVVIAERALDREHMRRSGPRRIRRAC